jgi:F420-non-reducing hydrogenase iron-sulfur subunit
MTIKRIIFLQELLEFMGIGERLHLEWISSAEARKYVRVITDFTEKIRMLGPNPLSKYIGVKRAGKVGVASGSGKIQTPKQSAPQTAPANWSD